MSPDVLVPEHAFAVNVFQNLDEIIEARVQLSEIVGPQTMCLGPVRPPAMLGKNSFKPGEQSSVWNIQPVRPTQGPIMGPQSVTDLALV